MSTYDDASLILYPSGYKASKLYSLKPTNGSGDLDVVRATTATRVNSDGLIEEVAINVPRIDYTGGGCGKLLLEPQRTNLLLRSEEFDDSYWNEVNCTITPNTTVSPDGNTTADTMSLSTNTGRVLVVTSFGAGTYTITWYVKQLSGVTAGAMRFFIVIDGVSTSFPFTVTSDWVRYDATFTALTDVTAVQLRSNGFIGDLAIWGAQLEEGSYPTSYIPTVAAAVTRNADSVSKTGISSLIGQTEGTLFFDGVFGEESLEVYLFIQKESSSGVDDSIYLQKAGGTSVSLNVWDGVTQVSLIVGGTFTKGQPIKIAAAYKANDFVLYANGVQLGTDNTGTVPTCGAMQLASYRGLPTNAEYIAKNVKQALLFKTRLSNSELENLTTL